MNEPTHRVYNISRWGNTSALVYFWEGHYESQKDPHTQFVRTRCVGSRVYTFDTEFSEADLRGLLDDELAKHGRLESVGPQSRRGSPKLSPRAVNVRSYL